jgi:ABC-type sugar transport system substrate-binding protein
MHLVKLRRPTSVALPSIGLALSVLIITGCGSSGGGSISGGAASGPHSGQVAFLKIAPANFTEAMQHGIEKGASVAGASVTSFDAAGDPTKQLGQCKDAISVGKYQGIVIEPVQSVLAVDCVEAAKEASIPVVAIETPVGPNPNDPSIQTEGVVGQVSALPADNGVAVGELTLQACRGIDPCEVAYQTISPAYQTQVEQRKATVELLEEHPEIEVVDEATTGPENASGSRKAAQDALQKDPGIDVIVSDDDASAIGAAEYVKEQDLPIKVIGTGANQIGTAAIKSGVMYGSATLIPHKAGEVAGEMITKAIAGEPIKPDALTWKEISPLGHEKMIVDKNNVNEWTPEW